MKPVSRHLCKPNQNQTSHQLKLLLPTSHQNRKQRKLKASQILQRNPSQRLKTKSPGEGGKATGPGKGDGKSKGKGDGKGKEGIKVSDPAAKPKGTPKSKATIPCLFFPKGTCNKGSECPFLHDAKAAPAAKAKSSAPTAKATVAFVAAAASVPKATAVHVETLVNENLKKSAWATFKSSVHAFVKPFLALLSLATGLGETQGVASVATLCGSNTTNCSPSTANMLGSIASSCNTILPDINVARSEFPAVPPDINVASPGLPAILSHAVTARSNLSSTFDLEWIADSGAGRDLGSERAFVQQGIPKEKFYEHISSVHPTKFETGNGTFTSDTCVDLQGESFGQAKFNVMDDCPLVRSLGKVVSSGKPFVWMPGEMPFFANSSDDVQIAADESQLLYAQRVEDFVPIFRENFKAAVSKALAGGSIEDDVVPECPPPSDPEDEDKFVDNGQGGEDLMREAMSIRHRISHMPKNPYCEVCRRARMYKAKTVKVRHNPLEARGNLEPVTKFGQRIASDFVVVNKTSDGTRESYVQVVRDEYSGYLVAYPVTKHDTETVTRNLLAFLGPAYHSTPTIMCKSDNAREFQASCNVLGFVHEPTLARRFPHNSKLERDIRTLEEITRSVHLAAGFHVVKDLWKCAVSYASVAMNQYHPLRGTDAEESSNRFVRATGSEFSGRELLLGQLVYVRKDPLERHKFEAAASPALFAGWRFDSGPLSFKNVYYVLDYESVRTQKAGYSITTAVPCEEVYVPDGPPVLPLKAAADDALAIFKNPEPEKLALIEVPFSELPSDVKPGTRHEYITLDRLIKYGCTPSCRACETASSTGRHTAACRARFDALIKADRVGRTPKTPTATTPVFEGGAPSTPLPVAAPEAAEPVPVVSPSEMPFSAGIPPGHPEYVERATAARVNTEVDELFKQNNQQRRSFRRKYHLKGYNTIFEYACSSKSVLGEMCDRIGVEGIRLSRDTLDLADENQVAQLLDQVDQRPGADGWVSLPCTDFCPWQRMNVHRYGEEYAKKLKKKRRHARNMFKLAKKFMTKILTEGGRVAIEWPADSEWWDLPEVQDFERENCFRRVYFHGCMLGVHGKEHPIKKPWCISTCDEAILSAFGEFQCDGSHQHEPAEGNQTKQTGFYTEQFVTVILECWQPQKVFKHIPDLSSVSALVTKNLTKSQWQKDEQAIQAIVKEAAGLRANGTWDDSTVIPVHVLKKTAKDRGETIKIAEVLTLAGIKHFEMPEEFHKYKGRIVYRGDQIRNQSGEHVFFTENETATTPTAIAALNLTLWFGLMTCVSCADCVQAYLQCTLDESTWVILPFELWLPEWKKLYEPNTKLAVRLVKSLYGHPQSGNLWQKFLEKQLTEIGGVPLESYPSNFVFRRGQNQEHTLILNIYVDDLTLAGGTKEIQRQFWDEIKLRVKIDPEEFIDEKGTKILGRVHSIHRGPTQNTMTYDMRAYASGIVDFFCEMTSVPKEKLRKVPTPCLPESNMTDHELSQEGELHSLAARILMRCLWLSRLARPDISFAVQRLASRVTKWTRWEDRQMHRLVSYLYATCDFVMRIAAEPNEQPTLHVFTDSDFASCPYTAKSTSGIVYVLKTGSSNFPLLWSSKKQSSTARSTTEAELIASWRGWKAL